MKFTNKWIEYIKTNNIDLSAVIENYSDSISKYIESDFTDDKVVAKDIKFLQDRIDEKNYGAHKDGASQLIKLISGWLQEDLLRTMLEPVYSTINGTDVDREVGVKPSNDPDLKIEIDGEEILVEVTNINRVGKVKFDDSFNPKTEKFKKMRWWQGRARKYANLLDLVKKSEKNVFLINTSDDFKSILIKKLTKNNRAMYSKKKELLWGTYIGTILSLDDEYRVFGTDGLTNGEISEKIINTIKELNEKY